MVTPEGLCRGCILAITEFDAAWYFAPDDRGRRVQLELIIPGLPRRPAMPIGSYRLRSDGRYHPPPWARRQRPETVFDDPSVCPPVMPGQLMLWRASRSIAWEHAARIRDRPLAGYPQIKKALSALLAEHGYSMRWGKLVDDMIRLALAVRDADGSQLIEPSALEDLPGMRDTVAELARRTGLLAPVSPADLEFRRPRHGPDPRHDGQRAQSCGYCLNWGLGSVCADCLAWAGRARGTCSGCHRSGVPLRRRRCRSCELRAGQKGPPPAQIQLAMHGPWTRGPRPHTAGQVSDSQKTGEVSEHLLWAGQAALADARRDWRPAFDTAVLPALTPAAAAVLARFDSEAGGRQWTQHTRIATRAALRVLLSWLGTAAPVPEAEVRALAEARHGVLTQRLLAFLSTQDLLAPDPALHHEAMQRAVMQRISEYPGSISAELERWTSVLRGQGRRAHRPLSWRTIWNYLDYVAPVLDDWRQQMTSLRQVTHGHVQSAATSRYGEDAHHLMVALRSIFRALKQERMIFANPCAGISVTRSPALPAGLPHDRVAGLLDRAPSPMARFAVTLVAIHALRPNELRAFKVADLDLTRARLTVRRAARTHVIYLDEITLGCADAWLRDRHRRWPRTANPHLFISRVTATDTMPVSYQHISRCFAPAQITASQLREDRILDEARHTADPVRLMRLFGIADTTAMKYVFTAHPERQSVLPR
jgi:integrase